MLVSELFPFSEALILISGFVSPAASSNPLEDLISWNGANAGTGNIQMHEMQTKLNILYNQVEKKESKKVVESTISLLEDPSSPFRAITNAK
jgi:hypothetical protein